MPITEKMTIDERYKYLRIRQRRYVKAKRGERSQLLDEMEEVTGLDRKTLIRRMHGKIERRRRSKQRGRTYGPEVDDVLRVVAESMDYIAAERLTPSLVSMAEHLVAHGELLPLTYELREKLGGISVSTVRRTLKRVGQPDARRLPRRAPRPANPWMRAIPTRRIPWDEQQPGHFEVDLVHHCGSHPGGDYVHTLQMIDVKTGWSERVAVLGRSYAVMTDAFQYILARLPFPVVEIHPDNGSEFFNAHLLRFWGKAVQGVQLSRSRPFHKNDNRFVEQKNHTLVRSYLGSERLDTVEQTHALNAVYDAMWLYYNLFQPVMRLVAKISIPASDHTFRLRRHFDHAQTPFDRLCATDAISPERREQLQHVRRNINPRQLRQHIYTQIDYAFGLPEATPGVTQNVLDTLRVSSLPLQKGVGIPVTLSFHRTIPVR